MGSALGVDTGQSMSSNQTEVFVVCVTTRHAKTRRCGPSLQCLLFVLLDPFLLTFMMFFFCRTGGDSCPCFREGHLRQHFGRGGGRGVNQDLQRAMPSHWLLGLLSDQRRR